MIYAIFLFILFSFISYRLIGIRASVARGLISSILSLFFPVLRFTCFIYKMNLHRMGLLSLTIIPFFILLR